MSWPDDASKLAEMIQGPASPPPATPDDIASKELEEFFALANLSAPKREFISYQRMIADFKSRFDLAHEERQSFMEKHAVAREELSSLAKRHAALEQSFKDFRSTSSTAALLMVLGGMCASVAGAKSSESWSTPVLWLGTGCFVCGFVVSLCAQFNNSPDAI